MKLVKFAMIIGQEEGEDDRMEIRTRPVFVNPETVRSVRGRNEGEGTRIEFPNSSAILVEEPLVEVTAALTTA